MSSWKTCNTGEMNAAFLWLQLGLKFPKADGAACIIDTSLYEPGMLMPGHGTSGPYPLVVRLETITPKGLADGHTLQVLSSLPLSPSVSVKQVA